ncbi:MAG TPA: hypothetical protein VL326_13595 [Kofleriaceae bacterium]|jgi:hypothetical protein|nr:hypothetical protein [Kofleriaceae bacterium]
MRWAALLVLVGACFNPTFHDPTCGPNGECPSGTQCVNGTCRSDTPGDDADVSDAVDALIPDAGNCTAQVDECLTGTDVLRRCDGAGMTSYDVTCNWGCKTTPTPHCAQIKPAGNGGVAANGVMPTDVDATAGLLDVTLTGGTVTIDGNTGTFVPGRGAGTGIISGIDFQSRGPISMFRFKSLTIAAGVTVRVTGSHPVALVADGTVTIHGIIDARGMNEMPGPGGYAGGTSSAQDGMGPGAGQGKAPTAGGGAGHGARGGFGGNGGGPGGVMYGDAPMTQLRGGSGGGSGYLTGGKGGGGGGAIQVVSNTSIVINTGGGINAGGQGGSSASSGEGGGGGAGGAILLEAPTLLIYGALAVNGGGGGASNTTTPGQAGMLSRVPALGANNDGGDGGAGAVAIGQDGNAAGGGGGGAVGRIRLDTRSGTAMTTGSTLSPALTDSASTCTQGLAALQ